MSDSLESSKEKDKGRSKMASLAGVAAVLGMTLTILEIVTGFLGVSDRIREAFERPSVYVEVRKNEDWESECADFIFANVPPGSGISSIELQISEVQSIGEITENQAARVQSFHFTHLLSVNELLQPSKLQSVAVHLVSDAPADSFIVSFCPTLDRRGTEANLSFAATPLDLSGKPFFDERPKRFSLQVRHPPSARMTVDPLND